MGVMGGTLPRQAFCWAGGQSQTYGLTHDHASGRRAWGGSPAGRKGGRGRKRCAQSQGGCSEAPAQSFSSSTVGTWLSVPSLVLSLLPRSEYYADCGYMGGAEFRAWLRPWFCAWPYLRARRQAWPECRPPHCHGKVSAVRAWQPVYQL